MFGVFVLFDRFHLYGDVIITCKELQILNYAHTYGHYAVRFFSVPHLDTGHPVYNGDLLGPVTLAPIAERLAVGLSLFVLKRLKSELIRLLLKENNLYN